MEFDLESQDLMKFEQEAPVWTWMAEQLMKEIWNFNLVNFLICFKKLIRIHLNFDFGLLRVGLINGFDSWLRA
jgi:hypothetical protein